MEAPKYKIVFCTPAIYSAGGVERMVSCKANYFAEFFGYDVTVVVTEGHGRSSFFPLSDKVKVVNLALNFEELWHKPFWKKVFLYLRKQRQYRKSLGTILTTLCPDITISTLRREVNFIHSIEDGSMKIGELHLSRANYRGMETADLSFARRLFSKWWRSDVVRQFQRFDRFVVLTDNAAAEWPELSNLIMIPDPMPLLISGYSQLNNKRVIAVGRYSYEKGFDMLLQIWSVVEKQCLDWQLDIYGMGDPTPYVKLMTELSVDKSRCHLNASLSDVQKAYCNSSVLVQTSRFEGFGLVLVEAMACGLPVVAFDCENGPRSIITDGEDGFLVPAFDIEAFSVRLVELMRSQPLREKMAAKGKVKSDHYSMDKVAAQWKALFDELMARK